MRYKVTTLASHGRECPYCHKMMCISNKRNTRNDPRFPTKDHVIPKSLVPNPVTVMVCRKCNLDKSNRTLSDWLNFLVENKDERAVFVKKLLDKPLYRIDKY